MEEIIYHRLVPPPEAFKYRLGGLTQNQYRTSGNLISKVTDVKYPPEGGILVYHPGLKHPDKGIRYDEEMAAVDFVKGFLLTLLAMMTPLNLFFLGRIRRQFVKTAHNALKPHILVENLMRKSARDALFLVKGISMYMGVEEEESQRLGEVVSALIEYDPAYDLILKDLFLNTTYESFLKYPIKEIGKMAKLFSERAPLIGGKFKRMALMRFLLLWPQFRMAFRYALKDLKHKPFEMDEADKYFALDQTYYDFFGQSFKERKEKWIEENGGQSLNYCYKIV